MKDKTHIKINGEKIHVTDEQGEQVKIDPENVEIKDGSTKIKIDKSGIQIKDGKTDIKVDL